MTIRTHLVDLRIQLRIEFIRYAEGRGRHIDDQHAGKLIGAAIIPEQTEDAFRYDRDSLHVGEQAMNAIAPRYQIILREYYGAGQGRRHLAEGLGSYRRPLSDATVQNLLSRAKRSLFAALLQISTLSEAPG